MKFSKISKLLLNHPTLNMYKKVQPLTHYRVKDGKKAHIDAIKLTKILCKKAAIATPLINSLVSNNQPQIYTRIVIL